MYLSLSLFFSLPSVNMVTLEKLLERTDISKVTTEFQHNISASHLGNFVELLSFAITLATSNLPQFCHFLSAFFILHVA